MSTSMNVINTATANTAAALQLLNQLNEMTNSSTEKSELENKLINEILNVLDYVAVNFSIGSDDCENLFAGENMKLIDFICNVENPIIEERSTQLISKLPSIEPPYQLQMTWLQVTYNDDSWLVGLSNIINEKGEKIKCCQVSFNDEF